MIPWANDIVDAAGRINGNIEIVTLGEVEREAEANYDWDVERAGLKRAKERIGGRWKACPSPQQTKWQLQFYEISGKKVEAHGDHLIVNKIAQHIIKHSTGDDLNVVLSSDRGFEGEYGRMETPRQRVVFPKLSPTPSDGRITLLDMGRKAITTLKVAYTNGSSITPCMMTSRDEQESPKKRPRDGEEVGGQGKGKNDKKATVNGLALLG